MQRLLLLLLLTLPLAANAMMAWTSRASGHEGHGSHGPAARPAMTLVDGDGAITLLWLPTLERRQLVIKNSTAVITPSGMESYHLLYAERTRAGVHETALRYHYLSGKPSGHSPAELIYADKTPLEILPAPLAREHARYLSASAATFLVRYRGNVVADHPVTLETSNGTHIEATSDAHGRVTFVLPDDFHSIATGRDNNPLGDFFVHTRYSADGIEQRTSLSAAYYVNPLHWQSRGGALWCGVAGFVAGVALLLFVARRTSHKGEQA